MPLPNLIEIVPTQGPLRAAITVPGSKSITNRALILAALSSGETVLTNALWSEDTQVMVECLRQLGITVDVQPDLQESCNRTIRVAGGCRQIRDGGTLERPLELFVGNAGTAARFLAAFVCLGRGVYRLSGVPRMHERPQAGLFDSLRQLGYGVHASNNRLPVLIEGSGPRPGSCRVSIRESSQFASALLLSARVGGWRVEVTEQNAEEAPYVEMTRALLEQFPFEGGSFTIEPDASSGSYFIGADYLLRQAERGGESSSVVVRDWPTSGWQIDADFPKFLPSPQEVSRASQLGDSIMTAMVLAPWAERAVRFTHLAPLRVQECERVEAVRTELTKCGAKVVEEGDSLTIFPSKLHGAVIETYNDHRMAMSFAILGLKVAGIKIKNPACVKKTFPDFFQKLARPAQSGLGLTIVDSASGRLLSPNELAVED